MAFGQKYSPHCSWLHVSATPPIPILDVKNCLILGGGSHAQSERGILFGKSLWWGDFP